MNLSKIYHTGEKIARPMTLQYLSNLTKIPIEPNNLVKQAKFLKDELRIRLAGRIIDLDGLPAGLAFKEPVKDIRNLYIKSFGEIDNFQPLKTHDDALKFTSLLEIILDAHKDIPTTMSRGIELLKKDINDDLYNLRFSQEINNFLNGFYMSRIGLRTLIELYIAISRYDSSIIMSCYPYDTFKNTTEIVTSILDRYYPNDEICFEWIGNKNINFEYIPHHLEYILIEILKNSVQATLNKPCDKRKNITCECLDTPSDLILQIRDKGVSFPRKELPNVFSYLYSTSTEDDSYHLSGYGHGLPLARLYTMYFGGKMRIVPYDGVGTDVIIYLGKHNHKENI